MTPDVRPRSRCHRRWLVAAAAIVAVLILVLAVMVVGVGAAWLPPGPSPHLGRCAWAAVKVNAYLCLLFLALGLEGLICIAMAAPLVGVMGSFGGVIGGLLRRRWERPSGLAHLIVLAFLPLLLAWERPVADPAQPIAVTTDLGKSAVASQFVGRGGTIPPTGFNGSP